MADIRTKDMMLIDDLFDMAGGYVLNFSDRTFSIFFAEELDIDIDDAKYAQGGTSKGKRLRYFLRTADAPTAVRTLKALWEHRETLRERSNQPDPLPRAKLRLDELLARLQGHIVPPQAAQVQSKPGQPPHAIIQQLLVDHMALQELAPQPRGFAFEKFLKRLFDAYGLEAREAFKLRGEQIDGSFQLGNETYLLEAKWQNEPSGIGELHTFHGKVEQKAAWTRGLFISTNGFSPDGLAAFGRGKRVVCMDGYDLYQMFNRSISLIELLERKVRHAAETGTFFARIDDLFV